eukprot:GHVS01077538.1.p1 GENE.GHVS01077538.1~~GHVS01077538.1.p1  ORF type:complete len:674 (+),score=109.12 GHVS01077538.1:85-2106(+)
MVRVQSLHQLCLFVCPLATSVWHRSSVLLPSTCPMTRDFFSLSCGDVASNRNRQIELTPTESEICKVLYTCAKQQKAVLRIAGGWVRDKLMGQESADIDVAVDNMSGLEFATALKQTMDVTTGTISVVGRNPEQSKHLETAQMKVCGVPLEFVNLRTETYADNNSRIPTDMRMGTPLEDATRRDFTINSLFYNINEETVEDLTGQGLSDLKAGIIRTPMKAKQTLLDDPLRALRGIRFASRFGYELDRDFEESAENPEVLEALRRKVSRERIGTEVNKMFQQQLPQTIRAVMLLHELKLLPEILQLPNNIRSDCASVEESLAAGVKFVHELGMAATTSEAIWSTCKNSVADVRKIILFSLLLMPYYGKQYEVIGKKRKPDHCVVNFVILESLKLPKRDAERVAVVQTAALRLFTLLPSEADQGKEEERRKNLGLVMIEAKELWEVSLLVSMCWQLSDSCELLLKRFSPPPSPGNRRRKRTAESAFRSTVQNLFGNMGVPQINCNITTPNRPTTGTSGTSATNASGTSATNSSGTSGTSATNASGTSASATNAIGTSASGTSATNASGGDSSSSSNNMTRENGGGSKVYRDLVVEKFELLAEEIVRMKLDGCWRTSPLLDGKKILQTFTNIPRGPAIGEVLQEQVEWMLCNPEGTEEACKEYLKSTFPQFVAPT